MKAINTIVGKWSTRKKPSSGTHAPAITAESSPSSTQATAVAPGSTPASAPSATTTFAEDLARAAAALHSSRPTLPLPKRTIPARQVNEKRNRGVLNDPREADYEEAMQFIIASSAQPDANLNDDVMIRRGIRYQRLAKQLSTLSAADEPPPSDDEPGCSSEEDEDDEDPFGARKTRASKRKNYELSKDVREIKKTKLTEGFTKEELVCNKFTSQCYSNFINLAEFHSSSKNCRTCSPAQGQPAEKGTGATNPNSEDGEEGEPH